MTCWFSHDLIRDRQDGVLVLRCQECGHIVPILQSEMVTDGPRQQPAPVLGQPQGKAQTTATRSKLVRADGRFK